jgi:hypothetical protein
MSVISSLQAVRALILASPRAATPKPAAVRVATAPDPRGSEALRVLALLREGPPGAGDALFAREVQVSRARKTGPYDGIHKHPPVL